MPSAVTCARLLPRQLFAIGSRLPVAVEAVDEFGVFFLLLAVEILQLPADFDIARKVGAVFGAELRRFLLKIAAARMDLLKGGGGKIAAFGRRRGSAAMTRSGSPCDAARYSASARMRSVVAATS